MGLGLEAPPGGEVGGECCLPKDVPYIHVHTFMFNNWLASGVSQISCTLSECGRQYCLDGDLHPLRLCLYIKPACAPSLSTQ